MACIASWQPRPGRNPYDRDSNRASHSGSSAPAVRACKRPVGDHGNAEPAPFSVGLRDEHPLDRPGPPRGRAVLEPGGHLGLLPAAPARPCPSTPAVLRPALTSVTRRTLSSAFARERSISFCRLRTFFRSPALLAVKIRCRSRRTSSSTRRQSTASQSRTSPSGPFTVTVSNLPIGSGVSVHLVLTGSPDPRQLPFGPGNRPYPTSYAADHPAEVPVMRFPVSCRLSAVGVRFLGHPAPAGELQPSSRSAYRRIDPPDPNGVVVLRMSKTRPGRAPPLPRGRWCAPGRRLSSGRHLPLSSGQSLRPRWNIPSAGVTFTRRHQGFTHVRPSPRDRLAAAPEPGSVTASRRSSPRPPPPDGTGGRFGFYPGLRTPRLPATHAGAETGHRALARVLHLRHQPNLQRCLPLHSCTLTSHVIRRRLHHHRGHLPAPQPVRQRQHPPLRGGEAAGLAAPAAPGSCPTAPGSSRTISALPMSMPHTRSRYSGSSVTSSIVLPPPSRTLLLDGQRGRR